MDILDLIKEDHRKVESLFSEIEKAKKSQKLNDLFNEIDRELTLHAQSEELTFYPSLRECKGTKRILEEANKEHTEAKILLEQLKSLEPSSSDFKEKITELKNAVQHHVQEEESKVFSKIEQCMNKEQREELGQEFQEAKKKLEEDMSVASR